MLDKNKDLNKEVSGVKIFPVPFRIEELQGNINIVTNTFINSKEEIINKAIKFHIEGNLLEAERYYKYCLKNDFNDPRVFSNYGIILKNRGELKEAEISISKSIDINPNNPDAYLNLGNVLQDLGKLEEAEISMRRAIELQPDFADAYSNMGIILRNLGKLKEAESFTHKAIKLKADLPAAHLNLGNIFRDLGKLNEAELSTRKAIKFEPDLTEAYINLGLILKDQGKSKEAESFTLKAIKLQPDLTDAYINHGLILQDQGKLKEAESFTRKAIKLQPDLAKSHNNYGTIMRDLGDLGKAKSSFRKAIEIQPDFLDAHYNIGVTLMQIGKLKEAEYSLRKAIELKSDHLQSHRNLGEVLFRLGRVEEAIIYDWKTIELNPSFAFINSYKEKAKLINKTAFFVFSSLLINHFRSIIEINPSSFEILAPNDISKSVMQKIQDYARDKKIKMRTVNELIENNLLYEKLVSNRGDDDVDFIDNKDDMQIKMNSSIIKLLGKKNIRFMYTAGKNAYTISSFWNKYYDGILCFGPYHEERFKIRHNIPTSQMGYPRFDKYFKPGFEKDYLLKKYKCDPKKKTIVWLPTWSDLSSVEKYYEEISSLRKDYNIIVRAHPSMMNDDPENYKKLSTVDFNYIDDTDNDNVSLYALADLMLFDYGGPMFGSLYLNKNFAFLEIDIVHKNHSYLGEKSSEEYLKSFFPDRIAKLDNLKSICNYCLKNPPSNSVMKSLREEFFNTNYQGNSSKRAYELLSSNDWLG